MNIKPINDNIVLKIEEQEKVSMQSGIWIMNTQPQANNQYGIVVAVGQGRILNDGSIIEPTVKIGDTVLYDSFAGTKISDETSTYVIIKENNILGIL